MGIVDDDNGSLSSFPFADNNRMCRTLQCAILLIWLVTAKLAAAQDGPFGRFLLSPMAAQTANEDAGPTVAKEPQRIATRLATFGIPIVAPARGDVKEIQLHVSADQGKTWHLYYRVGAKDKYFPFKAAADGEYWFSTRLVGANSKSLPEGDLRPEMKVLVDTTPPRLVLSSQISESGDVTATWQATDPLLATQSLKLEYQTLPDGPWRTIVVPNTSKAGPRGDLKGSIAFKPRDISGPVNLRGEILDQAGNHAVAVDRVTAGMVAQNKKPFEPPIAGPATAPPVQSKDEGVFAGVSKWLGGALSGGEGKAIPSADPYASASPSDERSGSSAVGGIAPSLSANWAGDGMKLTDKGVKRISQPTTNTASSSVESAKTPKTTAGRRGPGRLASASTVREPRRDNDEKTSIHPTIQPPANGTYGLSGEDSGTVPLDSNRYPENEPEEIPPPKHSVRHAPEERDEELRSAEESMEAGPKPSAGVAPKEEHTDANLAVESLPNEASRTPIPSMPKRRPGEFRTRSPIASGLSGADHGPARPPVTPAYRNASASRGPATPSITETGRLPDGADPIYTNELSFGLEYDVNTVGPGGVSEVELWATRDGGTSWSRWGSDPDRRSPFEVEVDGEGAFGFRIVVMSRGGLATRPPQPGNEADQWVVVDSTAPKVALRGATYGSDERIGQLEIAWEAEDANLTEKSVNLYYSDRADGPWTRIVGDLANQGVHYWRVDSRIPPKIFVKVEVRDGAGNMRSDQSREPIRVEGLVPSGKIRRIVPREKDDE
jgi:hypothetical protein